MSVYEQLNRYDGRALAWLVALLTLQGLLKTVVFPFALVTVLLDRLQAGPLSRAIASVPSTPVRLRAVRVDLGREMRGAAA
jgi:hypothetical protein